MGNCTIIFVPDPSETYNLQYILTELCDIFPDNLVVPNHRFGSFEILPASIEDLI